MAVIRDEYQLGQTVVKSISGVLDTIRLDLSLEANHYLHAGTIKGVVQDDSGKPISDSAVVILDESYSDVANTITDTAGNFIFIRLDPGSEYHAYAKAPGFELSESRPFTINPDQIIELNFILAPDTQTLSVITGEVKNTPGLPVSSSLIELYKVTETGTPIVGVTFSNEIGQFVFRDIELGSYFLKVSAPGYFSEFAPVSITHSRYISQTEITLKEDLKASKGIVVGLITDSEDTPLADADVILYRIGIDQCRTPVDYTRTNHEGIYLFVNVPHGEYCVNSNRTLKLD